MNLRTKTRKYGNYKGKKCVGGHKFSKRKKSVDGIRSKEQNKWKKGPKNKKVNRKGQQKRKT